ncbi:MAG: hypothetical protein M4579_003286 [Chaenotheca gracillima]|nr:MAG: hypothetical protein M4579_003286 [Chaenotheca gracillima]
MPPNPPRPPLNPPLTPSRPPEITQESIQKLHKTQNLLHLLAHRNKNQHRRSAWWKWFCMLRRGVSRLLSLLDDPTDKAVQERSKAGKLNFEARERLKAKRSQEADALMAHLRTHVIPRCWRAFASGLVADNQFAALGLVLLAELGRVGCVIGLERVDDSVAPEEGRRGKTEEVGLVEGGDGDVDMDVGVAVERVKEGEGVDVEVDVGHEGKRKEKEKRSVEKERKDSTPRKKRKKKKREGDDIDELFKGLV